MQKLLIRKIKQKADLFLFILYYLITIILFIIIEVKEEQKLLSLNILYLKTSLIPL